MDKWVECRERGRSGLHESRSRDESADQDHNECARRYGPVMENWWRRPFCAISPISVTGNRIRYALADYHEFWLRPSDLVIKSEMMKKYPEFLRHWRTIAFTTIDAHKSYTGSGLPPYLIERINCAPTRQRKRGSRMICQETLQW